MEEGTEFSGVESVFSDLASESTNPERGSVKAARNPEKLVASGDVKATAPEFKEPPASTPAMRRPKSRIGRPPGRKSSSGPGKEKATAYITADMKDAYIDWAYEERCSIGELMERALIEYHSRNRAMEDGDH